MELLSRHAPVNFLATSIGIIGGLLTAKTENLPNNPLSAAVLVLSVVYFLSFVTTLTLIVALDTEASVSSSQWRAVLHTIVPQGIIFVGVPSVVIIAKWLQENWATIHVDLLTLVAIALAIGGILAAWFVEVEDARGDRR